MISFCNSCLLDEKYEKAQKDFSTGLDIALNLKNEANTKYLPDLYLGLATAYLLDNEPQKCLETIVKDTKIVTSTTPMTALDFNFLNSATNLLLIKGHRKTIDLWEKALNEREEKRFVERFDKLIRLQQKGNQALSKEKTILLARAWFLIAEHSHNLKMIEQAGQAFILAQSLFLSCGLKEEALDIGKKIDNIKSHSKS